MARASIKTLLPVDSFAKILGVHPLHFNGVYAQDLAPATTCGQPLAQYAWQSSNAVSREDIAQAIADAEDRIAQYTRFKLAPDFVIDERRSWPRSPVPELYASRMWNARQQNSAVKTEWAHVISGGVRGSTVVQTGAGVVYTDTDGDGYKETATIAVNTTITDPSEIRLFYPGESGAIEWEIRPIKVTFANGVATIRARREQFVNPGLIEGFSARGVDGMDDPSFLATVDVYRVFHDPSQQIQFLWESQPSMCGCGSLSCTTCYLMAQFGCMLVRDYRTGMVTASSATWNSATQVFESSPLSVGRAPDKVRMWYRAGYRDQTQARPMLDMKPAWARAVTYFATALLNRPMCSCQNLQAQMEYWQDDMSKIQVSQSTSENFQVDRSLLSNPFGMSRGAIHAWRTFQREAIGEAALI